MGNRDITEWLSNCVYICVSAPGSWIAAIQLRLDQAAQAHVSFTDGKGLMVKDPTGPFPVRGGQLVIKGWHTHPRISEMGKIIDRACFSIIGHYTLRLTSDLQSKKFHVN